MADVRVSWLEIEPDAASLAQVRVSWLEIEEGAGAEVIGEAPPVYGGRARRGSGTPRPLSDADHLALVREKWEFIDAIREADAAAAAARKAQAQTASARDDDPAPPIHGAASFKAAQAPSVPVRSVSVPIDLETDDDDVLAVLLMAIV